MKFVLAQSLLSLTSKYFNESYNIINNEDKAYFLFYHDLFKTRFIQKEQVHENVHKLEGNKPSTCINENKTRCLQSVDADVATSPRSPCPTPFSNNPQSK
jgi:hypothetical protein